MTPSSLAFCSAIVFAVALIYMLIIAGVAQGYYRFIVKTPQPKSLEDSPFFYVITAGAVVLVFAFFILLGSGCWYVFLKIKYFFSPLRLALLSILIGIFPLLISMLASSIAKALGCSLNEAGVSECKWRGIDLGPTLYTMFMFGWLAMFTMGFMFFGLIGSAVWALVR